MSRENDRVVDTIRINIDIWLPVKQPAKTFLESTDFLCDTLKEYLQHWLSLCCDGEDFATMMCIEVQVTGGETKLIPPSKPHGSA